MSNQAVQEMIDLLESDTVDDPEELLVWLGTDGLELLKELLLLRKLILNVAMEVIDNATPDSPCYSEKLISALNDGLMELQEKK